MKFLKRQPMRVLIVSIQAALVMLAMACSSTVSTSTSSNSPNKYNEDLSVLRPKVQLDTNKQVVNINKDSQKDHTVFLEPRHNVNEQVDQVLDSIDRIYIANGLVDGYTIQLYSGTQRDEALNVKKQMVQAMPDIEADIQFVQPNFRVRAGKYLNRLDAHKDYMALKRLFPNAIVIPERLPLH